MAKPKKYRIENKDYFAWEYEEQTKIKHKVISAYSKIWLSKVGFRKNTIFFDCHGGCGAYVEKNNVFYGSTILVNKIAESLNAKRGSKTAFIYCEIDKENFDNFQKVIEDAKPTKIKSFNENFENVLNNNIIKKYYNQYPTLFFIDPFGYNLNIFSCQNLLNNWGNEIIINFMFDFINRFISEPSTEPCYNNFFGTDEWKKANEMTGLKRETFLVDLYKKKIKEITKAKYVFAYRLCYPNKNQTYYYLIHLTNHIDGITLMKESFASINNGRVEYLGKNNNVLSLFDLTPLKAKEMYDYKLKQYRGKSITFHQLWESIVEETAYTSKDLNLTLQELEKMNIVEVSRISSKRCSYKEDDIITFLEV